jgi:LytS/YehU family sensor histidine kinase
LPVLFTRANGQISWYYVLKIWKDQVLLLPLFAINHWLFVPRILFRKKYINYLVCILGLTALFTFSYYYVDEILNKKPERKENTENPKPQPIPPFAHLLMYSLLIVGVDTGLMFSKKWNENEEKKNLLEKENAEMQLNILRNQISPHFFMNTLNNIYALIDFNTQEAKGAVMKLSKLMRYMLYENGHGKVKISKEFEFIKSYIDLMKIRFAEEMSIHFIIPDQFQDTEIPPMLFIFYIENAFKYGASYQQQGYINIVFEITDNQLLFTCNNTKNAEASKPGDGGLGLKNNENRLKLLFGNNYKLSVDFTEKLYNVSLAIPLK